MPRREPSNLIWGDLETTGLDPARDEILEFGVVITDRGLNEIARFRSLVLTDVDAAHAKACDYVKNMHEQSGLWADLYRGEYAKETVGVLFHYAQPLPEIVAAITDLAIAYDACGGPLCNHTPQFDRSFLTEHCPDIDDVFNHRCFDVSTFLQWLRWQGKPVPRVEGLTAHRALDDVLYAIAQMRAMRGTVL